MIAGIVLAAGRSTRMGSPKALLTFGGQTFLARLVTAFAEGGCDPIVVVTGSEADRDAARIGEEARALGALTMCNANRGSPQIESLRTALNGLPSDLEAVIATPVDSPGSSPGLVAAMIEVAANGAPIVIATHHGRRGHPTLFSRLVLPDLRTGVLEEGARTVIRRYEKELVELAVEDPRVLLDIDTPSDYQRLREAE